MDYKYIEQLLDSYWAGDTSLEEENILRAFFSQKDVPAELLKYKDLFVYQQAETTKNVLGKAFDAKILSIIEKPKIVKAKVITIPQRLMPLFRAAAIVAIILTLGNASQALYTDKTPENINVTGFEKVTKGASVAMGDSATIDTLQQNKALEIVQPTTTILK